MDLIKTFERFPDQESCIIYLETVRWGDDPRCPHCEGNRVGRRKDGNRIGRWNCHQCKKSYNVLQGTIFSKSKLPLQKWFLAIAILINAKKSVSSHQLARDLDISQPAAWYLAMRIRKEMIDNEPFLLGIVEADETFISTDGSRKRDDDDPPKRGRGTKKLPVIGAVARGGKVVAQPAKHVTAKTLTSFLQRHVVAEDSFLITDEFSGYRRMGQWVPHETINHSKSYAQGLIHTNSIESFWSLLKRALFGSFHHFSREYASAYVTEACWKFNNREQTDVFETFLAKAVKA